MVLTITSTLISLFTSSYATITALITKYSYAAIFGLMLLEGSSLPVPSEVVLPLAGLFAQKGLIDVYIAFFAALLGSIGGLIVDYYIGYVLGKEVVYKHLRLFHIRQESLDNFDRWFERNGNAAVFVSRLIPVARTFMSFPAGFARMNAKKFFSYSIIGTAIWDAVLLAFGYYFLSASSAVYVLTSIGVFAIVLYLLYHIFTRRIGRHNPASQ